MTCHLLLVLLYSDIVFNNQQYKTEDLIVINAKDGDNMEVGVIQSILMKTGSVLFVSKKYEACRNQLNFFVSRSSSDQFNFIDPFHLADF